ncbi:hypothetical protein AB0F81_07415 [Actinoplanes sp. NPDC024001]|uniref:hypothetical protein n=1 Tax=Actinoplanes sp. NPDC024001 TaxID=3154598 RepID=UPI0033C09BB4
MTDDEIIERLRTARPFPAVPARIGGHDVRVETVPMPDGATTTVFRVRDGRVTVLRAELGSFREDVAAALLDLPAEPSGVVRAVALHVAGLALDRAVVRGPGVEFPADPVLSARTVSVDVAHRSEVLDGEDAAAFLLTTTGKSLGLPLHDWNREPLARADARLLDDWPGGPIRRSRRRFPWPAERLLTQIAPEGPSGVRVEIRDVRGYELVVQRRWDRIVGTLTPPGGGTVQEVDVPRRLAWRAFAPIFRGEDVTGLETVIEGAAETDVLEMRYQTEDRGWAELPALHTLEDCEARLSRHIARTPGNWAVFTSRSDAVVQVSCEDGGRLWLETPDAAAGRSRGRFVTGDEAARMLRILASEDRSAVEELGDLETVSWD